MTSSCVEVKVTCDEIKEKIESITLGINELPQKFFVAYLDRVRSDASLGGLLPQTVTPAGACLYESEKAFKENKRPIREINLIDSIGQNGIRGSTKEPMLILFTSRNQAA